MASVSLLTTAASSANNTPLTSGSFTPAAGDLLVVAGIISNGAIIDDSQITDSQGLGWRLNTTAFKNTNADRLFFAVASNLASNVAMTVTVNSIATSHSGIGYSVLKVSGVSLTGLLAVRQDGFENNASGPGIPAPAFPVNALTGNPTIGVVANGESPAGMTEPIGWTELTDSGYSTPTTGFQIVSRDSGFTGKTILWGSASATDYGSIIEELDATVGPVNGTTSLTFSASATLTGPASLAGTSTLVFTPVVNPTAQASVSGSSSVSFTTMGTLAPPAAMVGTSALTFVVAGVLTAPGAMSGTTPLVFTPAGLLTATATRSGSTSLTFSASGSLIDTPTITKLSGRVGMSAYFGGSVGLNSV